MADSKARSLVKALSWRVVASLATFFIGYFITGNLHFALMIGGLDVIIKIILYYFHERLWQLLRFGRK